MSSSLASSQTLAKLRGLQALREHRSKADHARALRNEHEAENEMKTAEAKLRARYEALDQYSQQGEFQIDRFQIFAQLITDDEAEFRSRREAHGEAGKQEIEAAGIWVRAEKQSEQLSERHREARVYERRRHEDKSSREFLSQWILSKGAKL